MGGSVLEFYLPYLIFEVVWSHYSNIIRSIKKLHACSKIRCLHDQNGCLICHQMC